ncbi:MAG: tRNA (adenosine(37)-N6)-dimethylallyltransferase MiaA [Dehalococcoidia bacterium]|nr:tRNA (adenosine(37)-N6)-dimethylallyltransferase MiaA [Dehalococcoidia bacterium]MDD5494758.1 tRNA (adenosine(37)-N6)-dimethylallyltransferase MiaA [Dehalococcoidia bacterium]
MKCLVAIIGPTAVGKTDLGISVAQELGGEIINADSRQIYKLMDIGTAKPTIDQRNTVPHHLIDIIFPDEPYSVALYQKAAGESIADIQSRNRLPILLGGSGQYIWSLIEDWSIPGIQPDSAFRQQMLRQAGESGSAELYEQLKGIDPETAGKILPNNIRRIIRALEIFHATGQKPSQIRKKGKLPFPVLMIGLTAGREKLYELINSRTDRMIESGFVEEVSGLLKKGYTLELPSMSSIGYRQIGMYLQNEINLEEAVRQIKFGTHRFARGQYAWFHLSDSRIKWFDVFDDIKEKIHYTIETFLHDISSAE